MTGDKRQKADLCVLQDQKVAEVFLKREKPSAVPVVIVIDQIVPPNSPEVSRRHKELYQKAEKENISYYYGKGMCGDLLTEQIGKKGQTVVVCDKAATAAGAEGIRVFPAGETELEAVLETGYLPEMEDTASKLTLSLKGSLGQSSAKDQALWILREAGTEKIKGKIVEIQDRLDQPMEKEARGNLCASLVYAGAKTAYFVDDADGAADAADGRNESSAKTIGILCKLDREELAVLPGSYDAIASLNEIPVTKIKSIFLGGTVGGNLDELRTAALLLKGRKIAYGVRLTAAPVDAETYIQAATLGYITDIMEAGGMVINHCGSPVVQARIGKDEVMISNDLENADGYAGLESSRTFIASTKAAVEAALVGTFGWKEEVVKEEETVEKRSLTFEGRCWKFGNDIDTDIIIPTQHLNYETMDEVKTHAFEPLRPELAAQLREGDLIVAGNNFGCGSSREQAAEVLAANGVHCVIAKSFARIFFRNAINNGILLLECDNLADKVEEGDVIRVELDKQQIIAGDKVYSIPAIPENLYHIIMDGGLVKSIEKKVQKGLL